MKKRTLYLIIRYINLYLKKEYRSSVSKKIRSLDEEFNYLNKNVISTISRFLSIIEIISRCLTPFIVLFLPVYLKYSFLVIITSIFLFRIKKINWKKPNLFFHRLFIQNALIDFFGIIFITLNLIVILNYYIYLFIAFIIIISQLRMNLSVLLYAYPLFFITLIAIVGKVNYHLVLFICIVFVVLMYILAAYKKYRNPLTIKNKDRYLTYINIMSILRHVVNEKQTALTFAFPPFIIVFIFLYYIAINIDVNLKSWLDSLLFIVYIAIYYLYVKRQIFSFDYCLYFTSTKVEFYNFNPFMIYWRKIVTLIFLNFFNIFWGISILYLLSIISLNIINVIYIFLIHIFILCITQSANVFADYNKHEISRYPVDVRKYISLLEALFIMVLFSLIYAFFYIIFITDVVLIPRELVTINSTESLIGFIVIILGGISFLKTINHMFTSKKNERMY